MTQTSPAELPNMPGAQHLGDLARGGVTWHVFLEIQAETRPVRARVHFVGDDHTSRSTGWIFVEWTEEDLLKRFHEFSALELWRLLESLA